jgi:hypothetical protein
MRALNNVIRPVIEVLYDNSTCISRSGNQSIN